MLWRGAVIDRASFRLGMARRACFAGCPVPTRSRTSVHRIRREAATQTVPSGELIHLEQAVKVMTRTGELKTPVPTNSKVTLPSLDLDLDLEQHLQQKPALGEERIFRSPSPRVALSPRALRLSREMETQYLSTLKEQGGQAEASEPNPMAEEGELKEVGGVEPRAMNSIQSIQAAVKMMLGARNTRPRRHQA
eukprot:TRINITY_DN36670_c0_g1_i1.p1 TRINITY_DN36670_c0_g1~~TRINITY_DN36670_c0_g1_i1.p1  ORF type:complete len:193 (-),score=27.13 TRINITY_DN36670_c0_g1_i1:342-920(-)